MVNLLDKTNIFVERVYILKQENVT